MKAMGNRIKDQRQRWGYTLEEVAKKVNVSKSTLSKLENGLLKRPPRPLIDKLANLYDCDPMYIMGYHHTDEVTLTYSAPGKEVVTLKADGKPIIGEQGKRAQLYQAAFEVAPKNLDVAINILRSLKEGSDQNA